MSREPQLATDPSREPILEVNMLDPDKVHFERMQYGGLSLKLDGEVYEHLRVYRVFPLSRPDEYIAIRIGNTELEQREIGQIRDINSLDPENRALVAEELQKRYFIHTVEEIISIREEMGYFYWAVETDKGRMEFPVPIMSKYISLIGPRGRLVLDVDGNRYGIPDLDALSPHSRAIFNRYIYW